MPSVAGIVRRRHNRKQRRQQQRSRGRLWSGIGGLLLVLLVLVPLLAVAAVSLVLYGRAAATLVDSPDTLAESTAAGTTRLYDRSGQTLLFSISDAAGSGPPPTLAQLPPYVWQATLLMQDADFLQQPPPGPIDTLTRLWRYVLGLPPLPDTSLTGQLVSNALLPRARHSGLDDALLQLVLTAEVSRRYTPEQILGWYLNTAYYGKDAYGIDAAARLYLGKDAAGLALDEAALLAAIPRAPEYNPYDDEASARGRQTNLLRDLLGNGLITQPDFEAAINRFTPLRVDLLQLPQAAPEFALYAREQAEDILNGLGLSGARLLARGGLRITTTLDMDLYHQAECVLRAHLAQVAGARPADLTTLDGAACAAAAYLAVPEGPIDAASPPDTGSLLLLNTENGEILALVGAVVAGQHPPGMMLAPFVYLEGILSGGFTPATMLLDVPQPFPGSADGLIYTPVSMDRRFRGPLLLRDALAGGLLPPAVFVADSGGMSDVLFVAHRMGLNTLADSSSDLSLLERGGAVSLLDLTYAYSVLASGGQMIGVDVEPAARNDRARNPVAILKIEAADGEVLWEYDSRRQALSRTRILEADVAYLLTDMLADREQRRAVLGVETPVLTLDRPVAVHNTLAGDARAGWTLGYTPQRSAGVYVGRSDDTAMSLDVYGLQAAAPVWQALMQYAHTRDALPPATPPRPENIIEAVVCDKSGRLPPAGSRCPTRREIFLRGVSLQDDSFWQSVQVNSQTGQRATASTPPSLVVENVYFVPPAAALDWWRSNRLPLPPEGYDLLSRSEALTAVQLVLPQDFAYVGGVVDVRGSIDAPEVQFFQLAYGQGLNPTQWFNLGERQTVYTPGASLGTWDTAGLDGIYTLQLAVTYNDNTRDNDFVQVTVDNTPPLIQLQAGEPGQVFRFPADTAIPVLATVQDNLGIDRVEFYHNGVLLGVDEAWPYGFEFQIQRTGIELFRAVAFDQTGNESTAELQVDIIRSSG